jgi:hypothetical protein
MILNWHFIGLIKKSIFILLIFLSNFAVIPSLYISLFVSLLFISYMVRLRPFFFRFIQFLKIFVEILDIVFFCL